MIHTTWVGSFSLGCGIVWEWVTNLRSLNYSLEFPLLSIKGSLNWFKTGASSLGALGKLPINNENDLGSSFEGTDYFS